MDNAEASLEVFVNTYGGVESIALLLRNPSILEHEGDLVPACQLTAQQALQLAMALAHCAEHIQQS